MRMLCLFLSGFDEFQEPPIGLEYELQPVELFTMDPFERTYSWNDAKEDGGEKIALVRVDKALLPFMWWVNDIFFNSERSFLQ